MQLFYYSSDQLISLLIPNALLPYKVYLIESVVSLLQEAKPGVNNQTKDNTENVKATMLNVPPPPDNMTLEESQLLGRYGVWLLVGLCTPREDTPPEVILKFV